MTLPLALIVDDSVGIARIFASLLQQTGYAVAVAYDGTTAATMLAETEPALVVLDLLLPYHSGETLLTQIRSDPRLTLSLIHI